MLINKVEFFVGMIPLHTRHTAELLKSEILKCCAKYNISINQVYSNTTDNGANMVKTSVLLNDLQVENASEVANEEGILEKVHSVLSGVRCAAHTLQLAAHDVLKKITDKISECREIIKKLRSSGRVGETNLNFPLDTSTRWNSSYIMLNSLLEKKSSLQAQFPDLDFNWVFIESFCVAFKPISELTLKLQKEDYVIGDFFRDWLLCELDLKQISDEDNCAAELIKAMDMRKKQLFVNDAFLAGIYIDPRFNFKGSTILTEEQKQKALVRLNIQRKDSYS